MGCFSGLFALLFCSLTACLLAARTPAPREPFTTIAKFSVDTTSLTLSSAVATIEPRRGEPGYFWVRIHFYPFPLTASDIAAARKGDTRSLDKKSNINSYDPKIHDNSFAVIQLSLDKDSNVGQVDMSIPGHGCTIAAFPKDVQGFLQTFHYDTKTVRLKSKGSHTCDLTSVNAGKQVYAWDFDIDVPVFATEQK